jgi:hypothetical protein
MPISHKPQRTLPRTHRRIDMEIEFLLVRFSGGMNKWPPTRAGLFLKQNYKNAK